MTDKMPTGTYIDFAKSPDPQKWYEDCDPPFPTEPKVGDMFMWKDWCGKYSGPVWSAKYFRFDGTAWVELGANNG